MSRAATGQGEGVGCGLGLKYAFIVKLFNNRQRIMSLKSHTSRV